MEAEFDLIVVGSGPAGVMAALEGVAAKANVLMIDFGLDDEVYRERIPDRPFSEIRRTDCDQASYFIGRRLEGVPSGRLKVGAQLTPPRQFVSSAAELRLPLDSSTFHPMQSLCKGGLGAAWGAACFTYSSTELAKIGIDPIGFDHFYNAVADEIGVSAPEGSQDEGRWWSGITLSQPPLAVDSNAEAILSAYRTDRLARQSRGFHLGRVPLAILSRDKDGRRANPYFDMDFYGDSRKSVFRPRYVVEKLQQSPYFTYRPGRLALKFEEMAGGVRLVCGGLAGTESVEGRRLMLCAGAINSGRLALNSLCKPGDQTTILANGYTYMPTVNFRMFGRAARDRRYSLAQLHAWLENGPGLNDNCSVQIYSYRSLLMFKLVKEMPLPPWLGLQAVKALLNSFAICGVFTSDEQSARKTMTLIETKPDQAARLRIDYVRAADEIGRRKRLAASLAKEMRRIDCWTLKRIDPGAAASIHYAGTIPFSNPLNPALSTGSDYRISNHRFTYVGDSSSWNWLPSKGLTFTLMASSRRIARQVLATL